jgi:hypothetical protein
MPVCAGVSRDYKAGKMVPTNVSVHVTNSNNNNNNSVALVRNRTIPTERLPFLREVSANFG